MKLCLVVKNETYRLELAVEINIFMRREYGDSTQGVSGEYTVYFHLISIEL
jgi:hypothetical protein